MERSFQSFFGEGVWCRVPWSLVTQQDKAHISKILEDWKASQMGNIGVKLGLCPQNKYAWVSRRRWKRRSACPRATLSDHKKKKTDRTTQKNDHYTKEMKARVSCRRLVNADPVDLSHICLTPDLWPSSLFCSVTGAKMDEAEKYQQRLEAIAVSWHIHTTTSSHFSYRPGIQC